MNKYARTTIENALYEEKTIKERIERNNDEFNKTLNNLRKAICVDINNLDRLDEYIKQLEEMHGKDVVDSFR